MMVNKEPYYQKVANKIIEQLHEGTAPWIRPWESGECRLPHNPVSGTRYKGVNVVWLAAQGYNDPRWMTYKQAQEVGAQVCRGEKGTQVQYWKFSEKVQARDGEGKPVRGVDGQPKMVTVELERPKVFSATVFNAQQIDGLAPEKRVRAQEWDSHKRAETILQNAGATIQHDQTDQAFYRSTTDTIHLPDKSQFPSADGYYATALHELAHWTGHITRLNRDIANPFGSKAYAKEEMRAEIASMMFGDELQIGHDPGQHVAYVKSWIEILQDDPKELLRASRDAEKITRFVMDLDRDRTLEKAPAPNQALEIGERSGGQPMGKARERADQDEDQGRVVEEKTYLAVPYTEKDQAKALGARWDRVQKSWFAPAGTPLEPLKPWLPENVLQRQAPAQDPRAEFGQALQAAGLQVEGLPQMDGKLHRVPVIDGPKGNRDGAYVGHMDGHPAGFIQNFRRGEKNNWKATGHKLSEEERQQRLAEAAQKRQQREAARQAGYEKKAAEVEKEWHGLKPAPDNHSYLVKKEVKAYGLKLGRQGELVIPVRDGEGKIWSLQQVTETGKVFSKDARKAGCYHVIDPRGEMNKAKTILIAEGYATGASVHQATGRPVVVAFDAGNLKTVAESLRKGHPDRHIVILGDDDRHGKTNVGRDKAEETAKAVGGKAVFPRFLASERGKGFTDFNDLARARGWEAVKRQVEAGIVAVKKQGRGQAARQQGWERQREEYKKVVGINR
jgi:antirestriction protein ArdC/phage/plasmid primase-like uncharacterized protein